MPVKVKVVDSSALAAILFGEPEGEVLVERLRGSIMTAPSLLSFEIASVCLKKMQLYPKQRGALLSVFEIFHQMEIVEARVDLPETVALAQETKLTVYDASYLWLALQVGAELVTLDKKLLRVAKRLRDDTKQK